MYYAVMIIVALLIVLWVIIHKYNLMKAYYQYMKKEGLGFKAGKVKADKTTLYYDDENYRVECYEKTKKWLYFETSEYYYKIYIPEGSIAEDYSVDLE